MGSHTVKEGETLASIAAEHGYRSWETIWLDAGNDALREKRETPGVLAPGDSLFLPETEPRDFTCQTNQKHTFKVKSLKAFLELVLEDEAGEPFANAPFKIVVDEEQTISGTTDGEGYFKEEIDPGAKEAKLEVSPPGKDKVEWTLKLGHLDPVSENTGVQAILNNLGYAAGEEDGEHDDEFRSALMQFQLDRHLEPTGEIDEATRTAMES